MGEGRGVGFVAYKRRKCNLANLLIVNSYDLYYRERITGMSWKGNKKINKKEMFRKTNSKKTRIKRRKRIVRIITYD